MINYLIEKYFTLLKGIAYGSASSMSAMDLYEFDKPEQLKNLNNKEGGIIMNILILEDTSTFVEEFVDILKNNNLFTDAHFFCLGDHFEKIDDTKDYQVIFIDVHLSKSINGIDFSIELKKRFPKALIVFVTMNNNFVHKSMELQPFYFIRKDHLNEDMSIFFKMFKEHLENTSFIVINAREKLLKNYHIRWWIQIQRKDKGI